MMSAIRPYFRTQLEAFGRKEHTKRDPHTVGESALKTTYHLQLGETNEDSSNQDSCEVHTPVTLRLYFPAQRDSVKEEAEALAQSEAVLLAILSAPNRLNAIGIKNIRFDTMALDPLSPSNDNGVIVKMVFQVKVIFSLR